MAKKSVQPKSKYPDSVHDIDACETLPDPIELIESMHELVTSARHAPSPISFMDSLALCSLTNTLGYIRSSVSIDPLDYRTRFFLSEIEAYADRLALRLMETQNPEGRINYQYPINFPASCAIARHDGYASDDESYEWINDNLEQMDTEGILPDDIDSTWSALYGMARHTWHGRTVPSAIVASCIRNLESVRRPGMPHIFNTWFRGYDNSDDGGHGAEYMAWRSEDIVAISSIVAFFDIMDPTTLAESRSFIFERLMAFIRHPTESLWFSEFYHSMPLVMYLMARIAWSPVHRTTLITAITDILECHDSDAANNGSISPRLLIQNQTDASLYIAGLARLMEQDRLHDRVPSCSGLDIAKLQRITESYSHADQTHLSASDPLYAHSLRENKTTYAASPIISSLVMLESAFAMIHISRNIRAAKCSPDDDAMARDQEMGCQSASIPSPYGGGSIHLTEQAMQKINAFEALKGMGDMTNRLISGTDFSICLDMCMALFPHDQKSAEDALIAHMLGLCAYFLYDKIYDQEFSPTMLPILFLTNSIFQEYIGHLMSDLAKADIDIPDEIQTILADTDISYYVLSTRGDDSPLFIHSKKSMGSVLVPVLCMRKAGMSAAAAKCVFDFFAHFNLARQISDDAKDAAKDESAAMPKHTTMGCFESQRQIECAIFREILDAKRSLDSLAIVSNATGIRAHDPEPDLIQSVHGILQKRLDEFLIKALHAKWELSVLRLL